MGYRTLRRLATGFAILCCMHALPVAAANLPAGDHELDLSYGQLQRSYIVHVPPQVDGVKPLPVVLNLHGGGGNARGQQGYVRMDALADRKGFIVVYPNGTGRLKNRLLTWNAGTCCGFSAENKIDDVGFIAAVLDDLGRRTAVDKRRVYATGLSNGAMMCYRLAAQLPNRIAAIAPVAGAMVLEKFPALRPMPVMHIHSVDDPRALYYGGLGPPLLLAQASVMHTPVPDTLKRWAEADHCTGTPQVIETKTWESHTAEKISYAPCSPNAEIVHWRLKGPGHVWPGGKRDYLPRLLGAGTDVIDANVEMWNFFSRYSLPAEIH